MSLWFVGRIRLGTGLDIAVTAVVVFVRRKKDIAITLTSLECHQTKITKVGTGYAYTDRSITGCRASFGQEFGVFTRRQRLVFHRGRNSLPLLINHHQTRPRQSFENKIVKNLWQGEGCRYESRLVSIGVHSSAREWNAVTGQSMISAKVEETYSTRLGLTSLLYSSLCTTQYKTIDVILANGSGGRLEFYVIGRIDGVF